MCAVHALVGIVGGGDRPVHQESIIIAVQLVEKEGGRAVEAVCIPMVLHLVPEAVSAVGKVGITRRDDGIVLRLIGGLRLLHPNIVGVLPVYIEGANVVVFEM